MTTATKRYQDTLDTLAEVRERFEAAPDAAGRTAIRPELTEAKERMIRAWEIAAGEVRAAIDSAPVEIRSAPEYGRGAIALSQDAPGFGCRGDIVRPDDAGYAAAAAELSSRKATDAAVAEIAYSVWGWRGPVRINYYGDAAARVIRGAGSQVQIDLVAMTGRLV